MRIAPKITKVKEKAASAAAPMAMKIAVAQCEAW
jgi:hypothetical protein